MVVLRASGGGYKHIVSKEDIYFLNSFTNQMGCKIANAIDIA